MTWVTLSVELVHTQSWHLVEYTGDPGFRNRQSSKGAAHTITHAYSIFRRQTKPPILPVPSQFRTHLVFSILVHTHTLGYLGGKKEWEKLSEAILPPPGTQSKQAQGWVDAQT